MNVYKTAGKSLLHGVQWLIALPFGIGSFIMGAFYAPTVVAGVHHMYTIIDLGQLAKFGVTYWLPLASAANVAQGGACGALFASVTGLGATGTGVTGIFGLLLCLNNPITYILMFVISFGVAFVLTWLFGYKDEVQPAAETTQQKDPAKEATAETITTTDNTDKKAETQTLCSPLNGQAIPLAEVKDEIFAGEVLGKGMAVIPSGELKDIRILGDTTAVEVYLNKGEVVFSTRYYPQDRKQALKINAQQIKGNLYQLDSMKFTK